MAAREDAAARLPHDGRRSLARARARGKPGKAKAQSARGKRDVALGSDPALWPGERIEPVTTLFNVWTHEALPLLPGQTPTTLGSASACSCATTSRTSPPTWTRASSACSSASPGSSTPSASRSSRATARRSTTSCCARRATRWRATASTWRATPSTSASAASRRRQVLHYVKSLRLGGVGYYPNSQFVHSDTGPIRYWTGAAGRPRRRLAPLHAAAVAVAAARQR